MNSLRKVFAVAGVVIATMAIVALPTLAQTDTPPAPEGGFPLNTITVVGSGTVRGNPDVANVDVGVDVFSANVTEAFAEANSKLEGIVAALTELGVAPEDIQTSNLSVYSMNRYNPEKGLDESGYQVSNTVHVIVRDVNLAKDVIDAAINAGATSLYGLSFDIADRSSLESDARVKAMEDAKARAEEYASLIGGSLGNVVVVTETVSNGIPFAGYNRLDQGMGGGGAVIAPGQTDVQINVQVTYQIVR